MKHVRMLLKNIINTATQFSDYIVLRITLVRLVGSDGVVAFSPSEISGNLRLYRKIVNSIKQI